MSRLGTAMTVIGEVSAIVHLAAVAIQSPRVVVDVASVYKTNTAQIDPYGSGIIN